MSYTLLLHCGCSVYVSCNPATGVAHTRIIEQRGAGCPVRKHERGARLWLWEMLPDVRRSPRRQPPAATTPDSPGVTLV
jgi:hypothetical protein